MPDNPLRGMSADDVSRILTTAADSIDVLKTWMPPETCDEVEKLIELVRNFLFKVTAAIGAHGDNVDALAQVAVDFHEGVAALEFTPEQFGTIKRLVHNVGEFQRDGSDVRTQTVCRKIADMKIAKWIIAWVLS